jgi:hypothetical protein
MKSNIADENPQPGINQYEPSQVKNLSKDQSKSPEQPDKTKNPHKKPAINQSTSSTVPPHSLLKQQDKVESGQNRDFRRKQDGTQNSSGDDYIDDMMENLIKATDKYEAAIAMQPEAAPPLFKRGERNSATTKEKTSSGKQKRSLVHEQESKEAAPAQVTTLEVHDKKRKRGNDFGTGTFWNRPSDTSRRRGDRESDVMAAHDDPTTSQGLIVDTGASHILFQKKHMHLLSDVQFSNPLHKPFATLRAANG